MTTERKELLVKINQLIDKRKKELLDKVPSVHEIDDGFIVRSFLQWDVADYNDTVKLKKLYNVDNPNETIMFYFLPKNTYIELRKRDYIYNIICLCGKLELNFDGTTKIIDGYTKTFIDTDTFDGYVFENTYIVTTSKP